MPDGWIKLHKSIMEWEWWDDAIMVKAFIGILMSCKNCDTHWRGIMLHPGQCVTTLSELSDFLCLSTRQVRTVLSRLIQTGEITIETTNRYSVITVRNWSLYQIEKIDKLDEADNQQFKPKNLSDATNKRQTNDKQTTNNAKREKESIKEKEEKIPEEYFKEPLNMSPSAVSDDLFGNQPQTEPAEPTTSTNKVKKFVKPTPEEVQRYCDSRHNGISGQEFCDYYESKGWVVGKNSPMKDWQSAVRTWEKYSRQSIHPNNAKPIDRSKKGF